MIDKRDIILGFLTENKDREFNQRDLQKELFPNLNNDEVKDVLDQIIAYNSNLMQVFKENNIGLLFVQRTGLINGFLSDGGFTKIESDLKNIAEKLHYKENLQMQNLQLQNENLEHLKSIKEKEEKIRNLQTDNLRLSNWDIRFRWLIAIITFIIGFIINYFIGK